MSFAPSGMTDDPEVKTATSLIDYIFRRLALDYLSFDDRLELGLASFEDFEKQASQTSLLPEVGEAGAEKPQVTEAVETTKIPSESTAPLCTSCGNTTQRAGSCYVCTICGSTSGCS